MTETADIIDIEAGVAPGSPADALRRRRPHARAQSQAAYTALFDAPDLTARADAAVAPDVRTGTDHTAAAGGAAQPSATVGGMPSVATAGAGFPLAHRLAVADFVVRIGTVPLATYSDLLAAAAPDLAAAIAALAPRAAASGPFGHYPPSALSAEDTDGRRWTPTTADTAAVGEKLAAGLAHAHLLVLRPREASPRALDTLASAGWTVDEIVTLSQLVTFITYQVRVIHALRVLGGGDAGPASSAGVTDGLAPVTPRAGAAARDTDAVHIPPAFTQEQLWWEPWLPPLEKDALTPAHYEGLVERPRAALPYFRLLARDPGILRARTLADLDIFTNDDGGLGRAERELAAAATSRLNGCVFCASVHARAAARFSGRRDDVQRLLDDGPDARIDETWDAVVSAATALTRTPVAFGAAEVERLRAAGLTDQAVFDLASAAAFFNWANRLMLSIGEPRVNPDKLSVIRAYEETKQPVPAR